MSEPGGPAAYEPVRNPQERIAMALRMRDHHLRGTPEVVRDKCQCVGCEMGRALDGVAPMTGEVWIDSPDDAPSYRDSYDWEKCEPDVTPAAVPGCGCFRCDQADVKLLPFPLTGMFMGSRMIVCPDCGNKRCPRANDHDNACTGSNESGQPGSRYA